uniref:Uncharacterized protein n=1 Tax=Megaselia scalaris TaxID=36166 RepID=T1GF70_MEGSC
MVIFLRCRRTKTTNNGH